MKGRQRTFQERCRRKLTVTTASWFGRYRCSVCERKVLQYEPFSSPRSSAMVARYGPREPQFVPRHETFNSRQYQCPWCGAKDRDRLIAMYLREWWPAHNATGPLRILEIAPSAGLSRMLRRMVASMPEQGEYRTADLNRKRVDDNVDVCDMRAYPDSSWDLILCSHVLEHVADDRQAMRELSRVLRPSGEAIILVPINLNQTEVDEDPTLRDPVERWRRFGQDDHVRRYCKQGFVARLEECGFHVTQLGIDHFGEKSYRELALIPTSTLYVGHKELPDAVARTVDT